MMALLHLLSHPIDWWVKFAQIVQGLSTPGIAIIIGIISVCIQRQQSRIQEQQSRIQKQQAQTNRRQYRLSLFERRMKVFDSTLDFIALVGKEAEIKDFEPLFTLLRETREHKLLFGEEIGKFITELYKNGLKLRTTHSLRVGGKPVDTVEEANIIEWFAEQTTVAEQKFLQYIDFRQPY
jgi:hypothetical protein